MGICGGVVMGGHGKGCRGYCRGWDEVRGIGVRGGVVLGGIGYVSVGEV